jgi:hypothetical protein
MKKSNPASESAPVDQREALRRSEKKATEKQPDNFKDESTADKTVEIGPDMSDEPIKGIDPPQHRKSR